MNVNKTVLKTVLASVLLAVTTIFAGCEKKVEVTGILVRPFAVMVPVNNNTALGAYFTPSNATNWSMIWSSANPNIATVEQLGGDIGEALVTPHAIGETTITGKTKDGGFTSSATVIVNPVEIDDDYATLVPRFYFGNTMINDETVDIGKLITIKYHSRNKIVFSINEKFQLSKTENVECLINVNLIADITKIGSYTYKSLGEINVTIGGISYPAHIEGILSTSLLDLIIDIKNVSELGNIIVKFNGRGQVTVGSGSTVY